MNQTAQQLLEQTPEQERTAEDFKKMFNLYPDTPEDTMNSKNLSPLFSTSGEQGVSGSCHNFSETSNNKSDPLEELGIEVIK